MHVLIRSGADAPPEAMEQHGGLAAKLHRPVAGRAVSALHQQPPPAASACSPLRCRHGPQQPVLWHLEGRLRLRHDPQGAGGQPPVTLASWLPARFTATKRPALRAPALPHPNLALLLTACLSPCCSTPTSPPPPSPRPTSFTWLIPWAAAASASRSSAPTLEEVSRHSARHWVSTGNALQ